MLSVAFVEASEPAPSDSSGALNPNKSLVSIPLTHQTVYLPKGIAVGIGAGIYNPTENCDCLGVWEGVLEYFYSERVSGGINVRFFGGDLDDDAMVMNQRYGLYTRFHHARKNYDVYVSPVLGLETTSLETFREEWDNRESQWWRPGVDTDTTYEVEDCEKMFSLEGFSVGVEVGGGWDFVPSFGLMGSASYEYNFAGAQLLTLTPGFGFNLRNVWPWAVENLLAAWFTIDVNFQRYFNRGVDEWATSGYFGFRIGI